MGPAGVDMDKARCRRIGCDTRPGWESHFPRSLYHKRVEIWVRSKYASSWSAYGEAKHSRFFVVAPEVQWARELDYLGDYWVLTAEQAPVEGGADE